ncbi:MAG: hypothetical protein GWO00_00605, partial [Gemmatimonadetes bacterium]|nr:hypothetical protein [Gemmatimonadota bacterium]NIP77717.1 hypothetical protein [Gemmatimonadota bacterium]NIR76936.1 hypothetical protein [Gemmatimonadota bacterium]NIU29280.1 hypothetical protein [Gemmatimonadota bacterium]NIU34357.1 hypothetical protein [Gemmatimonadota bacterium]
MQGIVGYADVEARLPAYRMMAVVALLSAVGVAWGGIKNARTALLGSLAAVVLAGIGLGQIYPSLVQRFRVEP